MSDEDDTFIDDDSSDSDSDISGGEEEDTAPMRKRPRTAADAAAVPQKKRARAGLVAFTRTLREMHRRSYAADLAAVTDAVYGIVDKHRAAVLKSVQSAALRDGGDEVAVTACPLDEAPELKQLYETRGSAWLQQMSDEIYEISQMQVEIVDGNVVLLFSRECP